MAHNGNCDDDDSDGHDAMAHNGTMVMMMIVMAIIVTVINMMLWFTMAREMTIKIKMINARVKKARGALANLSGNFHISTH